MILAKLRLVSLSLPLLFCVSAQPAGFETQVRPFLAKNCLGCHNAKLKSGNLNLVQFSDASALKQRDVWESVVHKLRTGEMPPKPLPRPKVEDVRTVTDWIEGEFARMDRDVPPDPGRVTARRLNRYEYNNTVRDLLGIRFRPADDFPADDSGYGFDNIGDVLSLSPVLMERYMTAAERISRKALGLEPVPKPSAERYKAEEPSASPRFFRAAHYFPVAAEYELRVGVGGNKRRYMMPLQLELFLDGRSVGLYSVETEGERRYPVIWRTALREGEHRIAARLEAPPDDGTKPSDRTKNMVLDNIEVRGPFLTGAPPVPDSYKRIFACGHGKGEHTEGCVRDAISRIAPRAWRRPLSPEELEHLQQFAAMAKADNGSWEDGMQLALKAMLVSPYFLYRIEHDPLAGATRISDGELATRLSYFLWSSMPDDELFSLAAKQQLRQPDVLQTQVRRMLADPKAKALSENFAGQWLQIRNLSEWKPDPDRFPEFNDDLRESMYRETQLFFEALLKENRSVLDFIDADFSFVNGTLARQYGISGVKGEDFVRVTLDGKQRGGVLGQASVLTVSSYPTRTSPVLRGKWVLENLLGVPPPPPPPNVPVLDEAAVGTSGSLRQQMEKHRSNAVCASCHIRMDAIGFGLENYDAIGTWRTRDGRFEIDSAGALPNGKSFNGPGELRKILREDKDEFTRCLTEKMLTYALGRGLERYDRPAVNAIVRELGHNDYKFQTLIFEIVKSLPFQMRRAEGGKS